MSDNVEQRFETDIHTGLLLSPIIYRCLLKVLCPVSRPITTLECVLLKDNNRTLVARSGPEINFQASLCVLQGPRHNARCCFSIQHSIFLLTLCLETPKKCSGLTNRWTEPSQACWQFHFLTLWHAQGPQYSPKACRVEISFTGKDIVQCLLALLYHGCR